nr:glycoside hydrolase family 43 protein [uncultured Carboxylicivirga sp.]
MKSLKLVIAILCLSHLIVFADGNQQRDKKGSNPNTSESSSNKVKQKEIFYADPTIYYSDGIYYLTGTRNIQPLGFAILKSTDLKEWSSPSKKDLHMILQKDQKAFGENGFWAPQILKYNKEYLFAYTANEQVALAKSKKLLGPYTQKTMGPVDGSEKNIDPFLFQDNDGKYYLYHVRFNRGNYLWVAEFDMATEKILPETLKQCFGKTQDWEATDNYPSDPIMEGPTVLNLKDKYYLFYSANHFMNIDYAVGYAVSDSPNGPWVKNTDNPIIHRSIVKENGSGHGDIFMGKDQQLYYVYHVHNADDKVSPRRTRIVPLIMKWNEETEVYDFTVDEKNVIIPVMSSSDNE